MPAGLERLTTCCFTGHRPQKLPWGAREDDPRCAALKGRMEAAIRAAHAEGYRSFFTGMALGCDTWFCEAALKLREELDGLRVLAALPCETQARSWGEADRNRYYRLLEACDRVDLLQTDYSPDCMLRRNRFMVDRSTLLIAAFNGSLGGAMHTVNYARRVGVEVRFLPLE